jgi:hypothetical protein
VFISLLKPAAAKMRASITLREILNATFCIRFKMGEEHIYGDLLLPKYAHSRSLFRFNLGHVGLWQL